MAINDDTGALNGDAVTNDATLTFTGRADPGSRIRLQQGATLYDEQGIADLMSGHWSVDLQGVTLPEGAAAWRAIATDLVGNSSAPGPELNVLIDQTLPVATVTPLLTGDPTPIITGSTSDPNLPTGSGIWCPDGYGEQRRL